MNRIFFPHFLSKIRKLENCENLFLLTFKCAEFRRNRGQKNSSLTSLSLTIESVSQTSGIKLNTIKRSLCPVNCSHLVRFCQLLQIGSTMFHFLSVRGVPLKEKLHPMHKDAFLSRKLSFGELSPMVGPSFWWSSMGSQFDSLSVYISPRE